MRNWLHKKAKECDTNGNNSIIDVIVSLFEIVSLLKLTSLFVFLSSSKQLATRSWMDGSCRGRSEGASQQN